MTRLSDSVAGRMLNLRYQNRFMSVATLGFVLKTLGAVEKSRLMTIVLRVRPSRFA